MNNRKNSSFRRTIVNDFINKDFWKSSKQDWSETQAYYLTELQKEQLEKMGKIKKYIYIVYWILRDMFLKLSPHRRITLIVSILLLFHYQHLAQTGDEDGALFLIVSVFGILFVLMLELKDKLVAQDELNAGRTVQMAMMPDKLKETDHWQVWMISKPALDVGGDIIDFNEMDNGRFGVSLGDISGKGLGAALLMVKLQSTIRALSDYNTDLSLLAQKINKIYHRDKPKGSFASLIYTEPQSSGAIKYFNAGHLPPILFKKGRVIQTRNGSPALGILKSVAFKTEECKLEADDYFIMFSDGITEAMDKENNLFGVDQLISIINKHHSKHIQDLADSILNGVIKHLGDSKPNDDISLVVLKYIYKSK